MTLSLSLTAGGLAERNAAGSLFTTDATAHKTRTYTLGLRKRQTSPREVFRDETTGSFGSGDIAFVVIGIACFSGKTLLSSRCLAFSNVFLFRLFFLVF